MTARVKPGHSVRRDDRAMSEPTSYEIVIRGRASDRLLRPLLDDFTIDHGCDGVTRLVGDIGDPAHLHGVLAHLTSVNAEVISILPCPPREPTGAN
ncbi:MAG: hypothetical protein QOD27_445 [Microbacteriaceae bacterium]|jgi:hypothetical protein|nr:hypothetical protein [Microbacteriaceae bacterium]